MSRIDDFFFTTTARELGLRVKDGQVSHRTGHGPIAGATARVESSGDIERRITATRLLAVGVFALAFRKKKDHRSLYLTIDGQGYQILADLEPKRERAARDWAVQFNNRAMAAA